MILIQTDSLDLIELRNKVELEAFRILVNGHSLMANRSYPEERVKASYAVLMARIETLLNDFPSRGAVICFKDWFGLET
jgi:hypothetical protein